MSWVKEALAKSGQGGGGGATASAASPGGAGGAGGSSSLGLDWMKEAKRNQASIADQMALPREWQSVKTPEGKTYFWNQSTGETSWTRPVKSEHRVSSPPLRKAPLSPEFSPAPGDDLDLDGPVTSMQDGASGLAEAYAEEAPPRTKPKKTAYPKAKPSQPKEKWQWNSKAPLKADDDVTPEERKRVAKIAAATMDKKSTHLVSGYEEWMGRHEKGKELRSEQDATDDKHIMELGSQLASKKKPVFLSDSHKLDLYGWNTSTVVRDGVGAGGKEGKNVVRAPRALAATKVSSNAPSPYHTYHDLCNRLAAQAIEEEEAR